MRTAIIILLFVPLLGFGQKETFGHWLKTYAKKNGMTCGFLFNAGLANGIQDAAAYHYSGFKKRFPYADDSWCDRSISWTNKYKNHDPAQGDAYFLSSTALVWTTDLNHFMKFQQNMFIGCAVAFKIGDRQKWYWYFLDLFIYSIFYNAGFNISYELIGT